MTVVELELHALRRPQLPTRTVLGRAALIALFTLYVVEHMSFPLRAALAVALGLAVAAVLARRHTRPLPAGTLRLSPGKLESSAHAPPVARSCSAIRDIEERPDATVLRRWLEEPFIIHHARLDVPPAELRRALDSWYVHDAAQREKHVRTPRMRAVYGLAVGLAVGLVMVFGPLLFL
jgi:hypothetical protein